jgi:hypothetical protein
MKPNLQRLLIAFALAGCGEESSGTVPEPTDIVDSGASTSGGTGGAGGTAPGGAGGSMGAVPSGGQAGTAGGGAGGDPGIVPDGGPIWGDGIAEFPLCGELCNKTKAQCPNNDLPRCVYGCDVRIELAPTCVEPYSRNLECRIAQPDEFVICQEDHSIFPEGICAQELEDYLACFRDPPPE